MPDGTAAHPPAGIPDGRRWRYRPGSAPIRLARSTEWPLPYVRNVRLEEKAGEHWLPMELNDEQGLPVASQWRWDPGPEPDGWPNKKN